MGIHHTIFQNCMVVDSTNDTIVSWPVLRARMESTVPPHLHMDQYCSPSRKGMKTQCSGVCHYRHIWVYVR